jgi:hypothetical protein
MKRARERFDEQALLRCQIAEREDSSHRDSNKLCEAAVASDAEVLEALAEVYKAAEARGAAITGEKRLSRYEVADSRPGYARIRLAVS